MDGDGGFRQVIFISTLLAFLLSVFEFFFTYYYLIPSIHKSVRKRFRSLAEMASDRFAQKINDLMFEDAAQSYIMDFQETLRYNLPDVLVEETHLFNFERVQFSFIISAVLGLIAIYLRIRWGPEHAPLNSDTVWAIGLSLVTIALFQFVFFNVITKRYRTWNDTELLSYALAKLKPILTSYGRVQCPKEKKT